MRIADNEIKQIVKTLEQIGHSVGVETAFRDWCECAALALANGCDILHGKRWQAREARYLEIIKRYDEPNLFAGMLAHLTRAFEEDPWQDYLGRVYMECFGGNKRLGQCFTPIPVCEICAEASLPDDEIKTRHKPITIADECCGGGAMLIAACKVLSKRGVDWQRDARFHCADLDTLCVHMCYVQLSLLGARAIVLHQNTITQQVFDGFVTPMELLWPVLPANDPAESFDDAFSLDNQPLLFGGKNV